VRVPVSSKRRTQVPPATARLGDAQARDGRTERGRRTRERLLEAVIELLEEGNRRPTAVDTAARAGVALRTLYHHFDDVEELRSEALRAAWKLRAVLPARIDPEASLEIRVVTLVRQLSSLYEAIVPLWRAEPLAGETTVSTEAARRTRTAIRRHLARTFDAEIKAAGTEGPVMLDALDTATSWEIWDSLRFDLGRSRARAGAIFELVLHNLLC
jgi:TetR/AcrR family transcriptional regulator of autoinduction and epiphytic fitness